VYYGIALSAKVVIVNAGKMLYREPRPFWTDVTIPMKELDCSSEYGNPSGHSLSAAGLALIPALDIIQHAVYGSNLSKAVKIMLGVLTIVIAIIYAWTMGYSRVVVGVHSWNQIIYGWLLGVWVSLALHFAVWPWLKTHATSLTQNKQKRSLWLYLLVSTAIFLGLLALQLGIYFAL